MSEFAGLVTFERLLPRLTDRRPTRPRDHRTAKRAGVRAPVRGRAVCATTRRRGRQSPRGTAGSGSGRPRPVRGPGPAGQSGGTGRGPGPRARGRSPARLNGLLGLRMSKRWARPGLARCLGAFAFAAVERRGRRLTWARLSPRPRGPGPRPVPPDCPAGPGHEQVAGVAPAARLFPAANCLPRRRVVAQTARPRTGARTPALFRCAVIARPSWSAVCESGKEPSNVTRPAKFTHRLAGPGPPSARRADWARPYGDGGLQC